MKIICKNKLCQKEFEQKWRNQQYCSRSCINKGRIPSEESNLKRSKANKNNPACAYWTGKKQSKESNKKRSETMKGKTWSWSKPKITKPLYETYHPQISFAEKTRKADDYLQVKCTYCGKWYIPSIQSLRNRIYSLQGKYIGENRLYCSKYCKTACPIYHKILYSDEQQQGTSREVQAELRQMVLERDNWTCQKCGKTKTELHCHHIEGIRWEPIESADIDKCITFCKSCHKKTHSKKDCSFFDLRC